MGICVMSIYGVKRCYLESDLQQMSKKTINQMVKKIKPFKFEDL